ncbi:MerR family transcriptional regulator [Novispirillum itersonii]|uniref:DNA-binding transcriptional MerR regulator n=1 Tax=Novispirillum itersonii TaxID=189 RepID=A0A7X0DL35_NOVIT|nr:DNA-binding transcriptional MerR regulator [Novispirillum itersonii]
MKMAAGAPATSDRHAAALEREFSISELAAEFGVTARAIRFYEDKGLVSPRRDGQRRLYSPRDRVRLILILRGKRLGFSLREIQEILDLYDAEPGEAGQLRHLLGKVQERRISLARQREDIDSILHEIDRLEQQCLDRLEAQGE